MIVENAGMKEVDGEYTYKGMKFHSGMFARSGVFEDKQVIFTLYKCNIVSNGYQWFISITPEGEQPGTKLDIDFYYALSKANIELLPPTSWFALQNSAVSKLPAPTVRCESPVVPDMPDSLLRLIDTTDIATAAAINDSDSENDDLSSVSPDDGQQDDSLPNSPLGSPTHRPRDYD